MSRAMAYPSLGFDIFSVSIPRSRSGFDTLPEEDIRRRWKLASEQTRHDAIDARLDLGTRYEHRNWNGEDADPIPRAAFEEARAFLYKLPSTLPLPDVTPEPDGYLGLEWYANKLLLYSVSFNGQGALSCSGLFGSTSIYGTYYLDDGIPGDILRAIARIVQ